MKLEELTCIELDEWIRKWKEGLERGIVGFQVGRNFRDKYGLTDMEALHLLAKRRTVTQLLDKRRRPHDPRRSISIS